MILQNPYLISATVSAPVESDVSSGTLVATSWSPKWQLSFSIVLLVCLGVILFFWFSMQSDGYSGSRRIWYFLAFVVAAIAGMGVIQGQYHPLILAFLFIVPVVNIILLETYLCDLDHAPRKLPAIRTTGIVINIVAIVFVLVVMWSRSAWQGSSLKHTPRL
jgi:mannitol-specific phosphotransferase system IIBC component